MPPPVESRRFIFIGAAGLVAIGIVYFLSRDHKTNPPPLPPQREALHIESQSLEPQLVIRPTEDLIPEVFPLEGVEIITNMPSTRHNVVVYLLRFHQKDWFAIIPRASNQALISSGDFTKLDVTRPTFFHQGEPYLQFGSDKGDLILNLLTGEISAVSDQP